MKWQAVWMIGVLLWLCCMGSAIAGPLSDRLVQFPDWRTKPPVQPASGDLVYPDWFAGTWTVKTTLLDQVAPLAPEIVSPGFDSNRRYLNQPIEFQARFVEAQLRVQRTRLPLPILLKKEPRSLVADRAFNGVNLTRAYLGDRANVTVKVDPDDPNRQMTLFQVSSPNGTAERQLTSTVVGRATETSAPDQFITTEVFQQSFLGAPQLYFNEVETTTAYRYQPAESPVITADQVTAIYLSPQDPDYFKARFQEGSFAEIRPVALYRYRLEFMPLDERSGEA